MRVSQLSPSYLQCIVPHTPWFTVRESGQHWGARYWATAFCFYLNFVPCSQGFTQVKPL